MGGSQRSESTQTFFRYIFLGIILIRKYFHNGIAGNTIDGNEYFLLKYFGREMHIDYAELGKIHQVIQSALMASI